MMHLAPGPDPTPMPLSILFAIASLIPATDNPAGENLLPLVVGNSWTYKVSGQDDRFVVKVARREMVGEHTAFVLEARLRERVVSSEHVALTRDGFCRVRVEKEDVAPPVCFLKLPPPAGRGPWSQDYKLGGRDAKARFSIDTAEVTVPAGKFKARSVVGEMFMDGRWRPRTHVWYAPDVGVVKQEVFEGKAPGPTLTLELERFDRGEK
jgi:hypothetical protein